MMDQHGMRSTVTGSDGSTSTTVPGSDGSTSTTVPGSDGSTSTTVTGSDGSTSTTVPGSDGSTSTTVTGSDGSTSTTVPGSDGSASTTVTGSDGSAVIKEECEGVHPIINITPADSSVAEICDKKDTAEDKVELHSIDCVLHQTSRHPSLKCEKESKDCDHCQVTEIIQCEVPPRTEIVQSNATVSQLMEVPGAMDSNDNFSNGNHNFPGNLGSNDDVRDGAHAQVETSANKLKWTVYKKIPPPTKIIHKPKTASKTGSVKRKSSAFNLYMKKKLKDNKGNVKEALSTWNRLPPEEKAVFQKDCAEYHKMRLAKVDPAKVIKEKLECLRNITAELEALGAHCITIAVKSTAAPGTTTAVHVTSTTSMRSAPFLTDPDDNVLNKFVQHVQAPSYGSTQVQRTNRNLTMFKKEVERTCRTLLNKAYGAFMNTDSKPFPYTELKAHGDKPAKLIVHGAFINPNGLSCMGTKAIELIIKNMDNISFERPAPPLTLATTVTVIPTPVATPTSEATPTPTALPTPAATPTPVATPTARATSTAVPTLEKENKHYYRVV